MFLMTDFAATSEVVETLCAQPRPSTLHELSEIDCAAANEEGSPVHSSSKSPTQLRRGSAPLTPSKQTNKARLARRRPSSLHLPGVQQRVVARQSLMDRRRASFNAEPRINCAVFSQKLPDTSSTPRRCQNVSEDYHVFEALGQGTTGTVYRGCSCSSNEPVALKVMRMDDEELLLSAQQEYELLRRIQHSNIIRALDFFVYPMGAVLVLDFFEGRTLEDAVREAPKKHLAESVTRVLFGALMRAVAHLHAEGIVHRDIKAANVLVSAALDDLRLVDFNTATASAGALTMTGTIEYLPPEVLLGESPSQTSDIWGAGLCLYLMLTGALPLERKLFPSNTSFGQALSTRGESQFSGSQWSHVSVPSLAVLKGCLKASPDTRSRAQDVLESEWLGGLPRDGVIA